jgi:hypothetical protein
MWRCGRRSGCPRWLYYVSPNDCYGHAAGWQSLTDVVRILPLEPDLQIVVLVDQI